MRRGAGPGLAVGIRLSADETLPEGRHAPETAAILRTLAGEGLIDYASAVIGDSASYLGSAWIVPPPPVARDAMREPAGILRDALCRAADRHLAHPRARRGRGAAGGGRRRCGRHDACADRRPRPAAAHCARAARTSASSAPAATRAASATTTSACPSRASRTRARAASGAARARAADAARACSSSAAGRPGMAAALAAAQAGAEVTLIEAADTLGGQFALAGRAPAHRETAARFAADWSPTAGCRRASTSASDTRFAAGRRARRGGRSRDRRHRRTRTHARR